MQIDCSEPENERGVDDQEHKGKCSEKVRPYESARDVVHETCRQFPNETMASEDPSNLLLQVLLSLSTDIIKNSYQHIGGKMGELPDLKKWTVAEAIVRKWGERICVMESDACVS